MVDDIYREDVMDHYKNPRNYGSLEDADVIVEEKNASCGDEIQVFLKLGKSQASSTKLQTIKEIKFEGVGCAVSMAFASMLIERVEDDGLGVDEVMEMSVEELVTLVGGDGVSAGRQKCVRMGAVALQKAMAKLNYKHQAPKPKQIQSTNYQKTKQIKEVVGILGNGGVVVLPTDTVWGVGSAISNTKGVEKLYRLMRRPDDKPTAVLVNGLEMAEKYGVFNEKARSLVRKYWPGGLTVIVEAKKEQVPELVRGGGETVGLRMPDHELVLELIGELGEGLVASSANVLGEVTPRKFDEIEEDFLNEVDQVVEGECGESKASTVVKVVGDEVVVVREGKVKV